MICNTIIYEDYGLRGLLRAYEPFLQRIKPIEQSDISWWSKGRTILQAGPQGSQEHSLSFKINRAKPEKMV